MKRSCSLFILIVCLQVISCQSPHIVDDDEEDNDDIKGPFSADDPRQGPFFDPYQERIPRHCWGPPPNISPFECCPIPRIFSDEEMETCGLEKPDPTQPPKRQGKHYDEELEPVQGPNQGPRHGPHHGPPDGRRKEWCSHGQCLLKNKGLLNDTEEIDYSKLRTFLKEWGKANPDFEEAIKNAIEQCAADGGPVSKQSKCKADKIFICLSAKILWNCKLREDLEKCRVLQAHMKECRPFYLKPGTQLE